MKSVSLFYPLLFLIFLASCTTPRFISAADMFATYGVLNRVDGSKLNGYFTNTSGNDGSTGLWYCNHQSNKLKDYKLISFSTVKSMELRGDVYEPRLLLISPAGYNKYVMLKRLSPVNFTKMCLYELDYDEADKDGKIPSLVTDFTPKKYYVQLPGGPNMALVDLESSKFTPDFDVKMSEIVSDCPVLSKKIASKQPGYYYAAVHGSDKTLPVFERIVAEYNNCK